MYSPIDEEAMEAYEELKKKKSKGKGKNKGGPPKTKGLPPLGASGKEGIM
jgi:hypothetical protein